MRVIFALLLALALVSGCSGDDDTADDQAAGDDSDDQAGDAATGASGARAAVVDAVSGMDTGESRDVEGCPWFGDALVEVAGASAAVTGLAGVSNFGASDGLGFVSCSLEGVADGYVLAQVLEPGVAPCTEYAQQELGDTYAWVRETGSDGAPAGRLASRPNDPASRTVIWCSPDEGFAVRTDFAGDPVAALDALTAALPAVLDHVAQA